MRFIGTSGWHYKDWIGRFYPAGLRGEGLLAFYLEQFRTVEINNSFYRLPTEEAFRRWYESTPADFLFAVKGSRFITHMKKLKDPLPSIEMFFDRVQHLREKTGPILFQLPPRWKVDYGRLAEFLDTLPGGYRYTFEFREPSWFNDDVMRLLERHNAAVCIYHLAGYASPETVTADFVYVRLHGPGAKYQGSYDDASLREWARKIRSWERDGKDVYVYFDNDEKAYAAFDAQRLIAMLGRRAARPAVAVDSREIRSAR